MVRGGGHQTVPMLFFCKNIIILFDQCMTLSVLPSFYKNRAEVDQAMPIPYFYRNRTEADQATSIPCLCKSVILHTLRHKLKVDQVKHILSAHIFMITFRCRNSKFSIVWNMVEADTRVLPRAPSKWLSEKNTYTGGYKTEEWPEQTSKMRDKMHKSLDSLQTLASASCQGRGRGRVISSIPTFLTSLLPNPYSGSFCFV